MACYIVPMISLAFATRVSIVFFIMQILETGRDGYRALLNSRPTLDHLLRSDQDHLGIALLESSTTTTREVAKEPSLIENAIFVRLSSADEYDQAIAQSSLYPSVDPSLLASAFNISISCLDSLNATVACDGDLMRMAGTVDNYLWDIDNVTALCTANCLSSASSWFSNVNDHCANDVLNVNGRLVPPNSIPGRIVDGMNIACLTPSTDVLLDPGINGSLISATVLSETNSTVTGEFFAPTATRTTRSSSSSTRKRQAGGGGSSGSSSSSFCLIESYDWVGSDIIRPDCPGNSDDAQCVDPTDVPAENERIANLYPNSLLCSDCFLKMFYLRVASPFLPDLDYSDYLVDQYFDIVDVCQAQMPDLLVRQLPYYDYTPGFLDSTPGALDSGANSSGSPSVACNQTLTADELGQLTVPDANANGSIYCDAISQKYNVATGDLQLAFESYYCLPTIDFTSVCVPAGCTLMQVPEDATWYVI